MTLTDHLRLLGARLWLVLLAGVLGASLGAAVLSQQPPAYEARTSLVLVPGRTAADVVDAVGTLNRSSLPPTLARVASSDNVLRLATTRTRIDASDVRTDATVANDSNVVELVVSAASPSDAMRLAAATGQAVVSVFPGLYPDFSVQVLDAPVEAEDVRPPLRLALVLGSLVGVVAGYVLAMAHANHSTEGDGAAPRAERAAIHRSRSQAGRQSEADDATGQSRPTQPSSDQSRVGSGSATS